MQTRRLLYLCSSVFICGSLLGCHVTHDEESATEKKQKAALNDPFHYGPDPQKMQKPEEDVDPTDITGGGTANLNKKLLKRDIDAVFGND